ncbi:MAG: winged helix-turn-helix transcriptional regulator [Nitrososphaerota archaeon]|nr:winged helix-turn-helix transcriptional regulator [Nitrososphaerota archaeon]
MLWWVFVVSKGGRTRKSMVDLLMSSPMNANQLASTLSLNYRTVSHHLKVLAESNLVEAEGPRYGQVYFPTSLLTSNIAVYHEVVNAKNTEGQARRMVE